MLVLTLWLLSALFTSCSAQDSRSGQNLSAVTYTDNSREVNAKLQELFSQETRYQHFSGTVLISNNSVIYQASLGRNERGITSGIDSRYDIGSVTKQFTAAAILLLVQESKLDLNDKINAYLGPYASDRWAKVTIHQLLTHTSGIPSIYQTEQGLPIFFPEETPVKLDELISRFHDAKLLFKPGEEFSYSNSGYVLLAAIIEQVVGQSYQEFMEEHIFNRYGLANTSFDYDGSSATPYFGYRADLVSPAPRYHSSWSVGGGGLYTTANDLLTWLKIIQSDSFLTPSLKAKYLESHTNSGYGYGWQVTRKGRIEHDGGTAGFMSLVSFDPSSGHQIIVLSNRGFEDIHSYGKSADYIRQLVDRSWEILEGREVSTLPKITAMAPIDKTYQLDDGTKIWLRSENDTAVWVSTEGRPITRLITNTPLVGNTAQEQMMIDLARLLYKRKHWSTAKYMDGEMKFVTYTGLLGVGMRMMRNQVGVVQSIIPYYVDEDHGLMRIIGSASCMDIIVYFDDEGKIQGLFEHGKYDINHETPMLAYPTDDGTLYIDGLNYGEQDAYLKILPDAISIYQLAREITAREYH